MKEQMNTTQSSADDSINPVRMSSMVSSNEQPVTKRQRIDGVESAGIHATAKSAINQLKTTPDILQSHASVDVQRGAVETVTRAGAVHRRESWMLDSDENEDDDDDDDDNGDESDSSGSATHSFLPTNGELNALLRIQYEYPDVVQTGIKKTEKKVKKSTSLPTQTLTHSMADNQSAHNRPIDDVDLFQECLQRQCLCTIDEPTLRRIFESPFHRDENGSKIFVPIVDWPAEQLIQYLSNVQFLLDICSKQNARGQICQRIWDVCDAFVDNEPNMVDEIFQLFEYNDKFVQFFAGRTLAGCLVFAKDKQDLYDGWLTTLVANMTTNTGSYASLRNVKFSLEIILRILEWRDLEEHPLEDAVNIDGRALDNDDASFSLPLIVPPIENNYFAMQFDADGQDGAAIAPTPADRSHSNNSAKDANSAMACQLQSFTDSESFDTTELKLNILCALKTKWSYLVDSMAVCTAQLSVTHDESAESTILIFLNLWERIISVQANLSVDSTLPFHEKLPVFHEMLISVKLPMTIYKQILTLFNESLCYGTTLALQSVLPEETNKLANEVFNSVKSQRIFSSVPRLAMAESSNDFGFGGGYGGSSERRTIAYSVDDAAPAIVLANHDNSFDATSPVPQNTTADNTLLQKLILLILKSIAVTVKPVRGDDSSDSSMDGCSSTSSTEFEAYQATVQIERATRDVLKKLNNFIKNQCDHHPETHFSKQIVHLFADQDDYLIEAMVCMLDTTTAFLPRHSHDGAGHLRPHRNQFRVLIDMLSPVYLFLEFLELISYKTELLLDLLISNETCFLLYLLRFLKFVRNDWLAFRNRCNEWPAAANAIAIGQSQPQQANQTVSTMAANASSLADDTNSALAMPVVDRVMSVLIRLRMQIKRLVLQNLFPYDITPITELLQQLENLYEGNDNELF